jgi:predicted translin family RNA/ssDNA-binding protein
MNNLFEITRLFTPIQPTIKQSTLNVTYQEFLPKKELQNIIYCYWQLKTTSVLELPFLYTVVADGCIDVFFELNKRHENYVIGFCNKFTDFSLDNNFNYFGIRFLPTMFPQLFKINVREISNKLEHLSSVIPSFSKFIEHNLCDNVEVNQIIELFDNFLLDNLSNTKFDNDVRLYNAIELIYKEFGVINVETDIQTGISQRQLRRLFEYYIGDTPKAFCKIVQFQKILKSKSSTQSLTNQGHFFDSGHYDQAHYIKDFKKFYGKTPSKEFKK